MGKASNEREASTAKRVEVACILRVTSCGLGLATRWWRGGGANRRDCNVFGKDKIYQRVLLVSGWWDGRIGDRGGA